MATASAGCTSVTDDTRTDRQTNHAMSVAVGAIADAYSDAA